MPSSDPRSFCFVHAADLHLDTPFQGIREVAPEVASALREASLQAFDAICNLALERGAAFLLVAGDVYDGAERGLRAQFHFRDGVTRLARAGIETFVVHGNHDPLEQGWSAIADWPRGVTVFPTSRTEVHDVVRDGQRIATVQGISYPVRDVSENLALRLSRPSGGGVHIGLLHCNVSGAADGHANYSPCTLGDLRATGLDYLALGHIHTRQYLSGPDGSEPWVVYPGNSQARSPKPAERGAKGAVVVHVEDARVREVEFVACDRVRFAEVEANIAGVSDLGALNDLLESLGRNQFAEADGRSLVLRARIVGRGPTHSDLQRPSTLDELLETLRASAPGGEPFFWWDSISDESAPPVDLEELRRRGDFASDLLTLTNDLRADPDEMRLLLESLLADAPRSLAEVAREVLAEQDKAALVLERAELLALEEITERAS